MEKKETEKEEAMPDWFHMTEKDKRQIETVRTAATDKLPNFILGGCVHPFFPGKYVEGCRHCDVLKRDDEAKRKK